MDAKTAVLETSAEKWRAHCERHPERFLPLRGTAAARRRIERWEAQHIDRLIRVDLPPAERAAAFRSIMNLRDSTGRDLAIFFAVDPQVVVLGLSLLEVPARAEPQASPVPAAPRVRSSRTRAA